MCLTQVHSQPPTSLKETLVLWSLSFYLSVSDSVSQLKKKFSKKEREMKRQKDITTSFCHPSTNLKVLYAISCVLEALVGLFSFLTPNLETSYIYFIIYFVDDLIKVYNITMLHTYGSTPHLLFTPKSRLYFSQNLRDNLATCFFLFIFMYSNYPCFPNKHDHLVWFF